MTSGLKDYGGAANFRSDSSDLIPSLDGSGEMILVKRQEAKPSVSEEAPPTEGASFSFGRIALICGAVAIAAALAVVCAVLVKRRKAKDNVD